ncbi:MAG: hypothetical protein KJZ78_23525 [Bryobacteraceae bacterium]|nr:hypothetical protein [Bryobacteraceae bacterium]
MKRYKSFVERIRTCTRNRGAEVCAGGSIISDPMNRGIGVDHHVLCLDG